MHSDNAKSMYLFMGQYSYNLNGTIGTVPSGYAHLSSMLPTDSNKDFYTGTLGLRLTLTRTDYPSGDSIYRMPYVFNWAVSSELSFTDHMMSHTTSSCFIPIADITFENAKAAVKEYAASGLVSSDFGATLENTNQYPTFLTAIDKSLVTALDDYIPG